MLLFQRATLALSLVLTSASAIGAPDITDKDKKLRGRGTKGILREANDAMVATGNHLFGLDAEGRGRRLEYEVARDENCSGGFFKFEVEIMTDGFPEDTSWTLRQIGGKEIGSVGNYHEPHRRHFRYYCLPAGNYGFTMRDPSPGSGAGYYQLKLNGKVLKFSEMEEEKVEDDTNFTIEPDSAKKKFVICAVEEPEHEDIICSKGQEVSDDVDFCKECEKMEEYAKQCFSADCVDGQAADK